VNTFVVFGKPAIAMAINMRSTSRAERIAGAFIDITSENLGAGGVFSGEGFQLREGPDDADRILTPLHMAADSCLTKLHANGGVRLRVSSKIPMSVGLGSSASTSVATIYAISKLFRPLSKRAVKELASGSEGFAHGHPSGIDQTICTYGGMIVYTRERGFRRLRAKPLRLVVGNTGIRRSTGELVGKVANFFSGNPQRGSALAQSAGKLVKEAIASIRKRDWGRLGELMNSNQALLEEVGVSTPELERLVTTALDVGALGAKLTGGGGGGCMIALCAASEEAQVFEALRRREVGAYKVKTESWGVR